MAELFLNVYSFGKISNANKQFIILTNNMGMRFQQAKGEQKYLLVLLKYLPILYVDSCKKYYMQYIYIYIYIYILIPP